MNVAVWDPTYADFFVSNTLKWLNEVVITPLTAEIQEPVFDVPDTVCTYILKGKLAYDAGTEEFTGESKAVVSLELRILGATLTKDGWHLPAIEMPEHVRKAILWVKEATPAAAERARTIARGIVENPTGIDFENPARSLSYGIEVLIKGYLEKPVDAPVPQTLDAEIRELTAYMVDQFADSIENLEKDLQDQLETITLRVCGLVSRHVYRLFEDTKVRTYNDAGVTEFEWSGTSACFRDHAYLEGRKFRCDSLLVTDIASGTRALPGYSEGCRCFAVPILPVDQG